MPTKQSEPRETYTIAAEEYEQLLSRQRPDFSVTGVAVEEGPHLKDKSVRDAKRAAMMEAGVTADDENITDDMRKILKEK